MIVYPAIDIRGGRVVRLLHGDPAQETVYGDDPAAVAERWQAAGAAWLHVVNLDGALGEATLALDALKRIVAVGLPVQFGGGLRSLDDARKVLEAGASRVILGTMAVQNPDVTGAAVKEFGADAVAVALDARGDRVATHGWQEVSAWTPVALGKVFGAAGVVHALYTDVSRDGDLSGVNVDSTAALARDTGLQVIASGGVATLDDIQRCRATNTIAGVITGKALYAGVFTLEQALQAAQGDSDAG